MNKYLSASLKRYHEADAAGELFTWLIDGKYKSCLLGYVAKDNGDSVWLDVPIYFYDNDNLISWQCNLIPKSWLIKYIGWENASQPHLD